MDRAQCIRVADEILHDLSDVEPEQVILVLARRLAQVEQVGVRGMTSLRGFAPEGWHRLCHCSHQDVSNDYVEAKALHWDVDKAFVRKVIDDHFARRHASASSSAD